MKTPLSVRLYSSVMFIYGILFFALFTIILTTSGGGGFQAYIILVVESLILYFIPAYLLWDRKKLGLYWALVVSVLVFLVVVWFSIGFFSNLLPVSVQPGEIPLQPEETPISTYLFVGIMLIIPAIPALISIYNYAKYRNLFSKHLLSN